jgi:fatty-acyl-CoA synthase
MLSEVSMSAAHEASVVRTIVDAICDQDGGPGSLSILDADGAVATQRPWSDVHHQARRMATVLIRAGVGPGRRVGVLSDTSLDLVVCLQAIWLTGAALTVLPPPTRRANTLAAVLADARLHAVVADPRALPLLAGGDATVLTLPELATAAAAAEPATPHRPDPADLAILQYSSGSTRDPRGVPVRHANLAANVDAVMLATDHAAHHPSRMLSWLPLYHDLGLIGYLALPMACGCSLLLQSPTAFVRRPASWLEAMSRHRVTSSAAPNFAYELMTDALARGLDITLDSIQFLLSGGEPIEPAMMARFAVAAARHGLDPRAIAPAYGLAESTLGVTFSPPGRGLATDTVDPDRLEQDGVATSTVEGRELVKLGRPVPGTQLRVVDRHTGTPLIPRRVGHVEISGASVVGHYWGEPEPERASWLRTGDLGYLTEDGELVVCGREKDILFAGGRNIFPQDIEAAAAEVPGVRRGRVAAFGVPGRRGDDLIVAVESPDPDTAPLRRDIRAAILAEFGLAPHAVLLVPSGGLPKTSSGKLRRAETRRRYQCGELTPLEGTVQ